MPTIRRLLLPAAACVAVGCQSPQASGVLQSSVKPAIASASPSSRVPRAVSGVLTDSLLTNEPLVGAVIELDGITRVTVTEARGAFAFDSVVPGPHRLVVRHPLLDSLGLDTVGVPIVVEPQSGVTVSASLPTPEQYLLSRCGPPKRRHRGEGIIVGTVRSAESDLPMEGVDVAAAWRGLDSTYLGGGLHERARVQTSDQGRFVLCYVPRFAPVELWTGRGKTETVRVRVQLGAAVLAGWDLQAVDTAVAGGVVAPSALIATTLGSIAGQIRMPGGDALPGVTVTLDRPALTVRTDTGGRFMFTNVPSGVRALSVRAIGFKPSRVGISLRHRQSVDRTITLDRFSTAVLGTILVRANRTTNWDSTGFEERRRKGSGYFFTREALKGITDVGTALRLVPGISGRSNERSQRLIAGRGAGCLPAFVVNGVRFAPNGGAGPEAFVRADEIRAMEVYTSRLSTPPEYQRYGDCSVIVIWLRDRQGEIEAKKRKPG